MHESFWDFSNRVYRQPEVSTACLFLQNSYGLDVNLLLFACWHAHTRGLFSLGLLDDALSFSSMWADNVVKPLRGARTWMKSNTKAMQGDQEVSVEFNELREQIKKLELQCERFQENMLESLVTTPEHEMPVEIRIAAALYNLRYLVEASTLSKDASRSTPLTDNLATLILRTLDEPIDDEIRQAITREFKQ